jgi:hypothetical protein
MVRTERSERTLPDIGAFYDVPRGLGFGFREYLYALALERDLVARVLGSIVRSQSWSIIEESHYLCATKLEVGLLLHFGREPKFYRVICENRVKRHRKGVGREE